MLSAVLLLALSPAFAAEGPDLQSPLGLTADRSCFAGPRGREAVRAPFNAAVETALAVVRECAARVEGLGFPKDLEDVLRRTKLVCVPRDLDPNLADASAYAAWPDEGGVPARVLELRAQGDRSFFTVLPNDLEDLIKQPGDGAASTLVHEALHQLGVNSRWDHAQIERVVYRAGRPCEENELDDRIVFLMAACAAEKDHARDLRHRIRHCGLERACVRPLSRIQVPWWARGSEPVRRRFDSRWEEHPEEALLVCENIQANLARLGPSLGDPDAAPRVELAQSVISRDRGGLDQGVPAYYLASLPPEHRESLWRAEGLEEALRRHCTFRGKWEPDPACPLRRDHPLFPLVRPLREQLDLEAGLEAESQEALGHLLWAAGNGGVDLDGLERHVVRVYLDACPRDSGAFEPRLCRNGESTLLQAIEEVRAKLGP